MDLGIDCSMGNILLVIQIHINILQKFLAKFYFSISQIRLQKVFVLANIRYVCRVSVIRNIPSQNLSQSCSGMFCSKIVSRNPKCFVLT